MHIRDLECAACWLYSWLPCWALLLEPPSCHHTVAVHLLWDMCLHPGQLLLEDTPLHASAYDPRDASSALPEILPLMLSLWPQVLKRRYGKEADIWSCGVILYILLSGVPPFWGETEQQIFDAVAKGHIDFKTDPWPHVSTEAKDAVRTMLQQVACPSLHHGICGGAFSLLWLNAALHCFPFQCSPLQATGSLCAMLHMKSPAHMFACRRDDAILLCMQDPKKRATADAILQHGWMKENGTASDRPLDNVIVKRMQGFLHMNKLKKEALKVMATGMSPEEIAGLRSLFQVGHMAPNLLLLPQA